MLEELDVLNEEGACVGVCEVALWKAGKLNTKVVWVWGFGFGVLVLGFWCWGEAPLGISYICSLLELEVWEMWDEGLYGFGRIMAWSQRLGQVGVEYC